jgi:hypothetical protein
VVTSERDGSELPQDIPTPDEKLLSTKDKSVPSVVATLPMLYSKLSLKVCIAVVPLVHRSTISLAMFSRTKHPEVLGATTSPWYAIANDQVDGLVDEGCVAVMPITSTLHRVVRPSNRDCSIRLLTLYLSKSASTSLALRLLPPATSASMFTVCSTLCESSKVVTEVPGSRNSPVMLGTDPDDEETVPILGKPVELVPRVVSLRLGGGGSWRATGTAAP